MQNFRIAPEGMRFFLCVLFTTFILLLNGQERCGTVTTEPYVFEDWIQKKIANGKKALQKNEATATVYEIPVVVHVIEPFSGGSLNISDDQIIRQIEILNEDFGRTNADASNTPSTFLSVAANTEIQFVLAKQDPSGNPSSGIVRIRGSRDRYNPNSHQKLLRAESFWPPATYFNIYVLDLQTFLGYASFPISSLQGINNGSDDYTWDGVLIDYQYLGENTNAPSFESFGRTATHEVGHYLGLRHIWGDGGCSVDDFVSDTPLADNDNGGLSSPCTFPSTDNTVCVSDEMFQNYMDYTDDTCMNLFTEGQKTRMRTVIENSPRRTTLISSPALIEPTRVANDLAVTKINTPLSAECSNVIVPSIQVTNYGNNSINSYDITVSANGSLLQTANKTTTLSMDQSEIVVFTSEVISSTPAVIEFEVSNVNGTTDGNSANNKKDITLIGTSSISLPFSENFESSLNLLGKNGPSFPWEVSVAPKASTSNNAIQFKAFQNTTAFGEETFLKTPIFDLSGINSAELKFSYSHAQTPDAFWDGLSVKVSTDCGVTFSENFIFNSYGPEFSTTASIVTSFAPQNESDWRDTTINITQFADTDGVQFVFAGQNGGGNNIFIDDISVLQTNLNATDISVIQVDTPLVTCKETTTADIRIRNVGFQEINSLTYQYTHGDTTITKTVNNLSLNSGQFQNIKLDLNLIGGLNQFSLEVTTVNGVSDEDLTNNSFNFTINKDVLTDSYPLNIDFETPNFWSTPTSGQTQLWSETSIESNRVLIANAFSQTEIGSQSWFISPVLDIGSLDSAGLSFKVSYAERTGFNDRLQVLMSINCGEFYTFELLNADSDSLATAQSDVFWLPNKEADWKEFKIDLKSSIPWRDNIRIAFVFTNGNGNNLYIDDIQIGIKPELVNENSFVIFPNPANSKFNVAFSLSERDDVQIQIIDMSGKIIFTQQYANVLNQVFDFEPLSQDGFYFVKIIGDKINQTERLYIRR